MWLEDRASKWPYAWPLAGGHAVSNAPALFRPPKLSGTGPGQYWGGGPPGKTSGCCQLLPFAARQKLRAPCKLTAPKVRSWATCPLHGEGLYLSGKLARGWKTKSDDTPSAGRVLSVHRRALRGTIAISRDLWAAVVPRRGRLKQRGRKAKSKEKRSGTEGESSRSKGVG